MQAQPHRVALQPRVKVKERKQTDKLVFFFFVFVLWSCDVGKREAKAVQLVALIDTNDVGQASLLQPPSHHHLHALPDPWCHSKAGMSQKYVLTRSDVSDWTTRPPRLKPFGLNSQ